MFLDQLSPRQKSSFLALATRVVMADGEISDGEQKLLDALHAEMGEVEKAPPEEIFGNTNLSVFDSPTARATVMLELFCLAFADTDFHDDENHVLQDVGKGFGFTAETLGAMRDWAQRRTTEGDSDALAEEGRKFMAP